MRKLFYLLLGFLISSCSLFISDEETARKNIEEVLIPSLRNLESYVFESLEPLIQTSEKEELFEQILLLEKKSKLLNKKKSEEMSDDELEESISLTKQLLPVVVAGTVIVIGIAYLLYTILILDKNWDGMVDF